MGIPRVLVIASGWCAVFAACFATYCAALVVHDSIFAALKKKHLLMRAGLALGLSSSSQSSSGGSRGGHAFRIATKQAWLECAIRRYVQLVSMSGIGGSEGIVLEVALILNVIALAAGFLFGQAVLGVVVATVGDFGLYLWLVNQAKRQLQCIKQQLPDALDSIAQSLRAGLSLAQAIARTAKEAEPPIIQYLEILSADVAAGKTIGEALDHFRSAVPIHDLKAICTALDIQYRTGGNMPQMLGRSAGLLRQSLMLERSLATQTAQSRMSIRVVGVVPLCLVGLMIVVMPGYLDVFVGTSAGQIMLVIALILDVVGFLWIRRISKVEVGSR